MKKLFEEVDLQLSITIEDLESIIDWNEYDQICINTLPGKTDDHQFGIGSLTHDWNNSKKVWSEESNSYKIEVPLYATPMQDSDFTEVCDIFKGTIFDDMMTILQERYMLGRVRIMKSLPKSCLSWHRDLSVRLHYPLKTQTGCKMVIEDTVFSIPANEWWLTDTLKWHTAFNASKEPRVHIVTCILGDIK